MSDRELDAFYKQEYRQLYQDSQGPNPKDLAIQAARAQLLLDFFTGAFTPDSSNSALQYPARHLDIGCSAGLLLQRFQRAYACQPVGIEPGTAYRDYARSLGLEIYSSLSTFDAESSARESKPPTFDLISLAHVLEHIANPVEYLIGLRQQRLTPDGWLLVETPNLYGHDCFEVAHCVSYSPHTLGQVLERAGYQPRKTRVHGQPRSEILSLYITVLAQATSESNPTQTTPERNVRRKRRTAMLRRAVLSRISPHKAWLPVPDVVP